jgi:hypothetical protein
MDPISNLFIYLSGLLRSEAIQVKSRIERYDFHIIREWDHEMTWYTMLVENKSLLDKEYRNERGAN